MEQELVNLPAIFYSLFWQTRELGFFGKIMKELGIDKLNVLIFFKDYSPGALISLDGINGDFKITQIDSLEDKNIDYDCAIIGRFRPIIKSLEGHFLLKNFWNLLSGKIKLKGKLKLLKFAKIIGRCAI
ncbi:MAG: hypothetical protein ACP6IY_16085 [Promethearchaeia archaeon]